MECGSPAPAVATDGAATALKAAAGLLHSKRSNQRRFFDLRQHNLETMELSPQLTARFERLQNAYPVKRSALIPMLMYAQDEFGFVSDEMIAEIAARLELR